jgi:serine/threonine-protein kinase HipA
MALALAVYLHEELAGHLIQDDGGQMSFEYLESWLAKPSAAALSQSLTLRKERFPAKECRGFFGGILPEESKREIVARNLGISARNDYAMLERIGGECAGAVTFIPAGQEFPKRDHHYRKLDAKDLAGILRELPKSPLLAGEKGIRLSLAGAQDKVAVRIEGDEVSLPLGGAPSTHILKPAVERFPGVVFNEALCMTLAAHMSLPAAKAEARKVEDIDYLLVERYDRKHVTLKGAPGVKRLHQEDFCQAQNVVSELKYQKEGGPSFKQCFALLRNVSTTPVIDLVNLLDAAIFNYLVGNNEAHGKNFSFVYPNKEVRLAPLYDVISTIFYPELNTDMAMRIGREYSSDKVTPKDFEQLAEDAGLAKPLVRRRVAELATTAIEALGKIKISDKVSDEVAGLILKRCARSREEFRT